MAPTGGSELAVDKLPAGSSGINATQIERVSSPSITEPINTHAPSATIDEALGNPLATDPQYRGFTGVAPERYTSGPSFIRTACAARGYGGVKVRL